MNQKKQPPVPPKRHPVQKPNYTKCGITLVNLALKEHGLHVRGTNMERCERLQAWFEKDSKLGVGHELADCSECGFASSEKMPACAFCGHDAPVGDESEVAAPVAAPVEVSVAAPIVVVSPSVVEYPEIDHSGLIHEGESADDGPPPAAMIADPSAAEAQLDAAILRYRTSLREMAGAGWDVGNAAREIHERKLYLARRDAEGKPVHRNWNDFCAKELGKSSTHVLRMIDVSKAYGREEAVRIGEGKLSILMRIADPEARARLLVEAESAKTTHRELAEKVRGAIARGEAGQEADLDRRGRVLGKNMKARPPEDELPRHYEPEFPPPTVMGAKPEEKAKPARRLTLIAEEGEHQVNFYARRKSPGDDKRRATNFGDAPKARLRMCNDTELVITLFQSDKGIYAKVQIREVKA